VIFANGIIGYPQVARAAVLPDDLLIAADGGALNCLSLGLVPAVVIGDMDSIEVQTRQALETNNTRFITFPRNKDQTDLELALLYAIQERATDILLLGLLGGRLDQTLANLLLLSRTEWSDSRLAILEGPDKAFILHAHDTLSIQGETGEVVSLLPLSPQVSGVTTRNLLWTLSDAPLQLGSTLGISNEITSSPAEVSITLGTLLVVHRVDMDAKE
jgi:thiamine pyrophosphokinase